MKKKTPSKDVNVNAFEILQALTGQPDEEPAKKNKPAEPVKNPAAVALGRLGGLKGGKARAAKLSVKQRKAIAKQAAQARWNKRSK